MLKRQIKEVYSRNIICIPPTTTVSNALKKMRTHDIGCLVVLEKQIPTGVLTQRSIISGIARKGDDFKRMQVAEIMEGAVISVTEETFFYDAFNLFLSAKTRQLVVVDENGHARGLLFISNLLEQFGYECFIDIKKVSQIMSRNIVAASGRESVSRVLRLMDKRCVSCVIITEKNNAVGIITEADIARLLSYSEKINRLSAAGVMSKPVFAVKEDSPLFEAAWAMRQKNIRHLVVIDEKGDTVGIATQSDIVRGLEGKYLDMLKKIIQEKTASLEATSKVLYKTGIYLDNILRSSMGMGIVATNQDLRIAYFNPSAENLLGYAAKDAIGKNLLEIRISEKFPMKSFDSILATVRNGKAYNFEFVRSKKKNNRFIEARISGIWGKEKNFTGFVLTLKDVTEKKRAEETVKYLAFHDNLTGLPNRALFNERMALELAHAKRNRECMGLMILDVDRFKNINDSLGHIVGDELLKALALRIKKILRKSDTAARMGGDEFYFIIPGIRDKNAVDIISKKLLAELNKPYFLIDHTVHATVSIGISIYPIHGRDALSLIKHADHAMYHAKSLHRNNASSNTYVWPTPSGGAEPPAENIPMGSGRPANTNAASGC